MKNKAVVLLSGGLDSAVALYLARSLGYDCLCVIFDYGQRHRREIESARRIARLAGCAYKVIKLDFAHKGSSLLDKKAEVKGCASRIPDTYVPARNIVFLSLALSLAEAIKAKEIFIGAHAQDYSGYPDCRPEFYRAFKRAAISGTRSGVEGKAPGIRTPLINKNKAQIIRLGRRLKVPFELTWSCYRGGKSPCGRCDSCRFRAKGFKGAGLEDPSL